MGKITMDDSKKPPCAACWFYLGTPCRLIHPVMDTVAMRVCGLVLELEDGSQVSIDVNPDGTFPGVEFEVVH